jgi:putative oxidoreductase
MLVLRISLTLLMLIWRVDKLVNVEHEMLVSERFYLGPLSVPALLQAFGVAQMALARSSSSVYSGSICIPVPLSSPA